MKPPLIFLIVNLFVIILFTGCATEKPSVTPTKLPSSPTPTEIKLLPKPFAPGDAITWQNLDVRLKQAEITDSFVTEFGPQRIPSPGQKFLWIRIQLQNTGASKIKLPTSEHFSVLYADTELKATYGHRQDHADYTALDAILFPGQAVDTWLRFDIPKTAELNDMRFIFLPESAQVGVLPSSPNYPFGGEHPVYVWNCKT